MAQIGVITEQGDLGLGFSPITEQDEFAIKKNNKEKDQTEESEE